MVGGSHPSWVCGLKPVLSQNLIILMNVTPFVGVWIETMYVSGYFACYNVTPFVGVWIETSITSVSKDNMISHTLRGCVD